MVFGQLTVALRSGGTMSPLPVSAFRIEHIVTVQPDEGLRIGVEGIPQRFVIHYFNIINNYFYYTIKIHDCYMIVCMCTHI